MRENRDGVRALNAQAPASASEHFLQALATSPFQAEVHVNLGLALLAEKKPEEALKSFFAAERHATTPDMRFIARFNAAAVLAQMKKIEPALEMYQKALEIHPDSLPVKINIELLTKGDQNKEGQGEGERQQQDPQDGDSKDQDRQDKQDQKKDGQDQKDPKDRKQDQKDGEGQEQKPKQFGSSGKYKPREFKGDLNEAEVKKILGEIKQQEQRIRTEYNRKDAKERPRDKDW
ncbi:MAG: hypothetical protein KF802_04490 [Bdellovibrionaceae bacterium]|nr:hypothetical protein [Pseudobdellovibrionaceae bacterium]MBX3034191.1 hypothetical protein [Pseudobdellovibrionaceae bacterium]